MRNELWYQWGRIAIRHARQAEETRARIGASSNTAHDSLWLDESVDAALIGTCSAAFSVEALALLFAGWTVSSDVVRAWSKNRTSAKARLREILKRSLAVDVAVTVKLVDNFEPAILRRNTVAHFKGAYGPPVPVGDGTFSTPIGRDFHPTQVRAAIDAMQAIYAHLLDHPQR